MVSRTDILDPIQEEFDLFEQRYASLFHCSDAAVDILLKFLLRRRGKFVRPILVLLTAKCFGEINEKTYNLASALELMHQGSLIHDDVVDESCERRGHRSVNAAYDNRVAVLLGDFIVSKALQEMSKTDNRSCIDAIFSLIGTLSEGELTQLDTLNHSQLSEDLYFQIITKKTAILFATCTSLAAVLNGASDSEIEAFRTYGLLAGQCFQIKDDILDYMDSSITGKPQGNDLQQGKFTLPAIYALQHSDRDWSGHIKAIRSMEATPQQILEVADFSVSNGGISYAESKMESLRRQAVESLPAGIPPRLHQALENYLEMIVSRQK